MGEGVGWKGRRRREGKKIKRSDFMGKETLWSGAQWARSWEIPQPPPNSPGSCSQRAAKSLHLKQGPTEGGCVRSPGCWRVVSIPGLAGRRAWLCPTNRVAGCNVVKHWGCLGAARGADQFLQSQRYGAAAMRGAGAEQRESKGGGKAGSLGPQQVDRLRT